MSAQAAPERCAWLTCPQSHCGERFAIETAALKDYEYPDKSIWPTCPWCGEETEFNPAEHYKPAPTPPDPFRKVTMTEARAAVADLQYAGIAFGIVQRAEQGQELKAMLVKRRRHAFSWGIRGEHDDVIAKEALDSQELFEVIA